MRKLLAYISLTFFLSACGGYSFTGASISPDVKTITIYYFENFAPLFQPNLSQVFTEKLKDIFIVQTSLTLVPENGDLVFEGTIIDYSVRPINIMQGDQAAQNRLTISVKVSYTNNVDPESDFEQVFTRFADFDANQELNQIEDQLMQQITTELAEDIFNKALVNW